MFQTTDNARELDFEDWPIEEIFFRTTFKYLVKTPGFEEGLWDGGCESCQDELHPEAIRAQGRAILALLKELTLRLDLTTLCAGNPAAFILS